MVQVKDSKLAPLLQQLQEHVESIQKNLGPVQDVNDALCRTRAAVDDVLYQKLDDSQYAGILKH